MSTGEIVYASLTLGLGIFYYLIFCLVVIADEKNKKRTQPNQKNTE